MVREESQDASIHHLVLTDVAGFKTFAACLTYYTSACASQVLVYTFTASQCYCTINDTHFVMNDSWRCVMYVTGGWCEMAAAARVSMSLAVQSQTLLRTSLHRSYLQVSVFLHAQGVPFVVSIFAVTYPQRWILTCNRFEALTVFDTLVICTCYSILMRLSEDYDGYPQVLKEAALQLTMTPVAPPGPMSVVSVGGGLSDKRLGKIFIGRWKRLSVYNGTVNL